MKRLLVGSIVMFGCLAAILVLGLGLAGRE